MGLVGRCRATGERLSLESLPWLGLDVVEDGCDDGVAALPHSSFLGDGVLTGVLTLPAGFSGFFNQEYNLLAAGGYNVLLLSSCQYKKRQFKANE